MIKSDNEDKHPNILIKICNSTQFNKYKSKKFLFLQIMSKVVLPTEPVEPKIAILIFILIKQICCRYTNNNTK